MKLRHPLFIRAASWFGACFLRLWMCTLRYRYQPIGPNVDPNQPGFRDRYIYALWHENMLLLAHWYSRPDIAILISKHADGQLIAEIVQRLGMSVIRGSTSKGGMEALRQMMRHGESGHVAITPDGPRGPRRRLQNGIVYLASRTGLAIVPVGVGYDRPRRARSWDRFAFPRLFTRGRCVTFPPISVPADLSPEQLEQYRGRVEVALNRATEAAEKWAESGVWEAPASLGELSSPSSEISGLAS